MRLSDAKEIWQTAKDHAWIKYKWTLNKDNMEEIFANVDYDKNIKGIGYFGAIAATDQLWQDMKEAASRNFWLAAIREEVEKENIDKKDKDQAI